MIPLGYRNSNLIIAHTNKKCKKKLQKDSEPSLASRKRLSRREFARWSLPTVSQAKPQTSPRLGFASRVISQNFLPLPKQKGRRLATFLFCDTTTKYVPSVLCYKNSPAFFILWYTYPLVLTGVDSNRYLPGCHLYACKRIYVSAKARLLLCNFVPIQK